MLRGVLERYSARTGGRAGGLGAAFLGALWREERWRGGGVERWRGGEVEVWRGGEVERWRGGEVVRWRGGEVGRW